MSFNQISRSLLPGLVCVCTICNYLPGQVGQLFMTCGFCPRGGDILVQSNVNEHRVVQCDGNFPTS